MTEKQVQEAFERTKRYLLQYATTWQPAK